MSILLCFVISARAENGCVNEKICLKVVSQRWLTEKELKRLDSLSLHSVVVRLRLSNETEHEIVFLTWQDSAEPIGYRLYRTIGETTWAFMPKTKERTEPHFLQSVFGGSAKYIRLKQNSALEFEFTDWANPKPNGQDEEHAFSIFIKLGGKDSKDVPIELISDIFRPLKK